MSDRFRLWTAEELATLDPPTWLIEGILPAGGLGVLVGERSTYKTFLALDWAMHVQLGMEWHGRRVRPGDVLYVYAEGRTGIGPRVAAWQRFHGYPDPVGVLFLPQRVSVNEPADTGDLLAALETRCTVPQAGLIVLDTLNRNFSGNENSTEDMSAFVRGCDRLREVTGATVLIVHHKGHGESDRGRGSSALDGAADTIIFASRDEDRLTLECKKQKDAVEFPMIALEAVSAGESLALKPSGAASGKLSGQRRLLLQALHDNYTAETGASYTAWLEAAGVSRGGFNKAREWLRANAYVKSDGGKWRATDAGRMALGALNSTHSTATPLARSGAHNSNSTPLQRVYTHASGGVECSEGAA